MYAGWFCQANTIALINYILLMSTGKELYEKTIEEDEGSRETIVIQVNIITRLINRHHLL
ncbi:MAG: hypothetical protein CVU06_12110 [Bacteroidetes bacterium HGW-Bacteroidetes-22]|nr:MAG: hypothetical protein CVU06_12110 [Bacteroidetes bacterium HGW-Bacteroidetes-22]